MPTNVSDLSAMPGIPDFRAILLGDMSGRSVQAVRYQNSSEAPPQEEHIVVNVKNRNTDEYP